MIMVDNLQNFANAMNACPYVVDSEISLKESEMMNYVHVMHLNIRSYLKNETKLRLILDELENNNVVMDVIMLCETFLNSNSVELVELPGYKLHYKNRDTWLGGQYCNFY